jgi:hypothetical protein
MSPQRRTPPTSKQLPAKAKVVIVKAPVVSMTSRVGHPSSQQASLSRGEQRAARTRLLIAAIPTNKNVLTSLKVGLAPLVKEPFVGMTISDWKFLFDTIDLLLTQLHFWMSLAYFSPGGFEDNWKHSFGARPIDDLFQSLYKMLLAYSKRSNKTALEREYITLLRRLGFRLKWISSLARKLSVASEKRNISVQRFVTLNEMFRGHRNEFVRLLAIGRKSIREVSLQAMQQVPKPVGFGSS